MKKNIIKILVFTFLILGFTNVHAEEVPVKNLPKDFKSQETGGYEYTIEGFDLRVYSTKVVNDSEMDEAFDKYLAETPDKTIPLTFDDLSINPESKETTINEIPSTIVDLNLNLTQEKLKNYLKTEYESATPSKAFLVELVVKYKLTKQKIDTTYKYKIDFVRNFVKLFEEGKYNPESFELNTTLTQTLNILLVRYDNNTKQNIVEYYTEATEENKIAAYILNYLDFSNQNISEQGSENKTSSNIFMLHNIDNIDYILESLQESNDDKKDDAQDAIDNIKDKIPGTETGTNTKQEVAVGNTAATIPSYFYIISIIMVITGIGIIGYTVVKE